MNAGDPKVSQFGYSIIVRHTPPPSCTRYRAVFSWFFFFFSEVFFQCICLTNSRIDTTKDLPEYCFFFFSKTFTGLAIVTASTRIWTFILDVHTLDSDTRVIEDYHFFYSHIILVRYKKLLPNCLGWFPSHNCGELNLR